MRDAGLAASERSTGTGHKGQGCAQGFPRWQERSFRNGRPEKVSSKRIAQGLTPLTESVRFLPDFFPEHVTVSLDGDDSARTPASSRRLELVAWLAAWDRFQTRILPLILSLSLAVCRYAVAAEVLGQMSYQAAMRHKSCVLEVSANMLQGRRAHHRRTRLWRRWRAWRQDRIRGR